MTGKRNILPGKIVKIHGFDGTVIIRTEKKYSGRIIVTEPVYIVIDGKPVPFFIDYFEKYKQDSLLLKFDGYNSTDSVREFVGCVVMLTRDSANQADEHEHNDLTGFTLVSVEGVTLGTVVELITNPGQYLLNVRRETGREMLIPLHEDLVEKIDLNSRTILMTIPEGLADIND